MTEAGERPFRILIPCYNDWEALGSLFETFRSECSPEFLAQCAVTIVDDGSTDEIPAGLQQQAFPVEILSLKRNLGHQKAIATGLSFLAAKHDLQFVLVMDADGEDKAVHLQKLVETSRKNGDKIVFAERTKRHEGFIFVFFYRIYRLLFYLLTGINISFGNNCCIPADLLRKLVQVPELWTHFPGAVIHSKLPFLRIPLDRGKRLAGKTKMNFMQLILYGLSAISVQMPVVKKRILGYAIFIAVLLTSGFFMYYNLIPATLFLSEFLWFTNLILVFVLISLGLLFVGLRFFGRGEKKGS